MPQSKGRTGKRGTPDPSVLAGALWGADRPPFTVLVPLGIVLVLALIVDC